MSDDRFSFYRILLFSIPGYQFLAKVYYPNLGFPLYERFPLKKEEITLRKERIPQN